MTGNRIQEMKEIGIAEFGQLVMERLASPRKFARRSLVLWDADSHPDGIPQRVIEQCCEKHEKENPKDQVWFFRSGVEFINDDFIKTTVRKTRIVQHKNREYYEEVVGDKRCGLFFNSGSYIPQEKDEWLRLVNTHKNRRGGVSPDCPMIFCTYANEFKEEQFGPNCDIYAIRPTKDEWVEWAKPYYSPEVFEAVCTYIEKYGQTYDFQYWMVIMDELENLKRHYSREQNKECSLWQVPEEELDLEIRHAAPDFCKFIHPFFEENLKKE